MAPPLNLSGRVFGKLLVLAPAPNVSRVRRAWLCRCDCGVELVVPQNRLPHAAYIAKNSRKAVDACPACRGRPCKVCGKPVAVVVQRAATCPGECRRIWKKRRGLASWRRRKARDPDLARRIAERRRERAATDPVFAERLRAWEERRRARHKARMADDPAYAERIRAKCRAYYARHAGRIKAERRACLDALSPAEREQWTRQANRRIAAWRRKHVGALKADPAAYQRYRDIQNEYRRLRKASLAAPPPVRTCVVCGATWPERKYMTVCSRPECRAEYGRAKSRESRERSVFATIERQLGQLAQTLEERRDRAGEA